MAQPRLHRQLGDAQVLGGDAVGRVADDERDVGALGRALRAQRRVVLDRLAAPWPGGACPAVSTSTSWRPSTSSARVDRVARGAGDARRRSRARSPRKRVDQRGLADVRAGRSRRAGRRPRPPPRPRRRAAAARRRGRAGRRCRGPGRPRPASGSPRPRPWNSCASGRSRGESILFAATHDRARRRGAGCRPAPRRRGAGRRGRRRRARATCGVGQRGARLVLDRDGQRVVVVEVHAAGVDQREACGRSSRSSISLRSRVTPGRSCTTASRDSRQAVDERGLADVRIADDGDLHASISCASTTSVSDLLDAPRRGQAGGVDRHGVRRRLERRVRAASASRSSRSACSREHGRRCRRRARSARRRARSSGAAVRKTLTSASGRDDRADVAALGDPVAVARAARCCLRDQRRAHVRVGARRARRPRRPRACGSPR